MSQVDVDLALALREIVRTVCDAVLGAEATTASAGGTAEAPDRALVGCVHIVGAWTGSVLLTCDAGFARRAAAIIFGHGAATEEDERDALGELTNMIAGNLKALLPTPSQLSLPAVAEGRRLAFIVPGSRALETVHMLVGGAHRVTVMRVMRAH